MTQARSFSRDSLAGRRYHFSGVGGSGMTPLAILAASLGAEVTGSDRNLDRGLRLPSFDALRQAGIRLVPQDGSGVLPGLTAVIHSAAVETQNADLARADRLEIPRIRRGSFLAQVASEGRTLAVAGTSGKSTVTAMVAHVLVAAGLDPSFIGGGYAVSLPGAIPPGSVRLGGSEWVVVETDESDGSVAEFAPAVSVITNLSRDHKEIDETARNFEALLARTSERAVLHCGDPTLGRIHCPESLPRLYAAVEGSSTWTTPDLVAATIRLEPERVSFEIDGVPVMIPFPGKLTVENGLLAAAAAVAAGVPLPETAQALSSFGGVRRRLERVGSARGVEVFDDFAHNPVKIQAALEALRPRRRFWIFYQPHGYRPTRFFRDELIETFRAGLRPEDRLLLAPIYDAGGTADRSIRSEDLVRELQDRGVHAALAATRADAAQAIAEGARPGDRVVVMGARDDTLPAFAREILAALEERAHTPAAGAAQRER